jgi:hypothetical protein
VREFTFYNLYLKVEAIKKNLETIKMRGCWSLRTLPVVSGNKVVSCDCEKEQWDKL